MSKRRWGAPTWIFLHTFVAHIKPEHFSSVKYQLLDWIKRIASVLPCPDCAAHATAYLSKMNARMLNTKEHLMELMWRFHNYVNIRLGHQIYPRSTLEIYNKTNLQYIYKVFVTEYTKPLHIIRYVTDDMARRNITTRLTAWLRANHTKFYE